jgi:hypothetical protein
MMRPADRAWLVLFAAVVMYEAAATVTDDWELLSEAADRHRQRRPILTHLTVVYVAGHLLRRWPRSLDPLHLVADRLAR